MQLSTMREREKKRGVQSFFPKWPNCRLVAAYYCEGRMEEVDNVEEDAVLPNQHSKDVEDSVKSPLTVRSRNRNNPSLRKGPQYCGAVHSVGFAEEANHRFRPTMEVGDWFRTLLVSNVHRTPTSLWTSSREIIETRFLESTMDTGEELP